jgi:RNA polymerase sigma-70 factor, ECF subfamily
MSVTRKQVVAELYNAYERAVRRRLARLGIEEPEIEDAVQDIFLIALRKYKQIPKDAKLARRWFMSTARRWAANWHRLYRHTYEEVVDPEVLLGVIAESEDRENNIAERELVHLALMRLGPLDLDVLRRHDIEGESLQEIADWLGITKSGAHVRLNHARERFVGHLNRLRRQVMSRARRATQKGQEH